MKIIPCQSFNEAAQKTSDFLKTIFGDEKKSQFNIFLPTGRTPRGLYQLFNEEKDYWSKKLRPIQIDEFVDPKRIFFEELKENLLTPLRIEKSGLYINPSWSDAEMQAHVKSVIDGGVDVALLGLGPNGHVGFHEPGYHENFAGGRVTISDETRKRVEGATTNETLTFGVGAFSKARHVILLALGASKVTVFKKFLELGSTPRLPATLLKNHPNFTVITDLK